MQNEPATVIQHPVCSVAVLNPFVTRRALTERTDKSARTCLPAPGGSESAVALAKAGEFPRAPAASATRRMKRDAGAFFWLLFFRAKEKEYLQQCP